MLAGVGELARYSRRSASSWFCVVLSFRCRRAWLGGGVRGGEELIMEELTFWKLCEGRSGSFSSSEWARKVGEDGSSGIVSKEWYIV